jgi:alanine racemase
MKNFWCDVYLDKIKNNVDRIKQLTNNKKLIAVVKGNAYGLGIEGVTGYLDSFVDLFAVGDIEEAKRVKSEKEILLLSPLVTATDFNIDMDNVIFTIDNENILEKLPNEMSFKIHLYIDTGMNRMGIKHDRLDFVIDKIRNDYKNIIIDGIYTHLHNGSDVKYTKNQISIFKSAVEKYLGIIPNIHCLNSTCTLNSEYREMTDFTNCVRAGNLLYGYDGLTQGFKKAYGFFAKPVNMHFVKKGEPIGYSCRYKAKQDMQVGVLGFGNIEHFGFNKAVKHNLFYDIIKVIYNHIKFRPVIFAGNKGVRVLGTANMNTTLISMEGIGLESILRIDISPILADSSVEKNYITN